MSEGQTPGYFFKEFLLQFFRCEEEEEEGGKRRKRRQRRKQDSGRRLVECIKAGSTASSLPFFSSARCSVVANLLNAKEVVFFLSCSINVLNEKMHSLTIYILLLHHPYHYLLLLKMCLYLVYVYECFTLHVCLCTTCRPGASIGQNGRW